MRKKLLILFLGMIIAITMIGCSNRAKGSTLSESKVVKIGFPGTQNFLGGVAGICQENKYIENELEKNWI